MDIMTHAKFHFNQLMLTMIFGIRAWRMTKKAGPATGLKVNILDTTLNLLESKFQI